MTYSVVKSPSKNKKIKHKDSQTIDDESFDYEFDDDIEYRNKGIQINFNGL